MTHQQQPIRHRHHQKSVLSFDPSRFDGPNASGEATSIALRYWEGHHGGALSRAILSISRSMEGLKFNHDKLLQGEDLSL
ncbi:hypothetical protein CN235_03270 [Sinorhizobium meliloti]|uniref:hypothetical protein n=1 Tax=Rhizobium meliloti TaxID=382 RepID=UPI000FD2C83A|nr:hypothetical protein [Sinorhizobium meliloti]RVE97575.1 hypothetical protein CN235_03270 [Sinorhizobium meliloti]